jgi:hypothetical protein
MIDIRTQSVRAEMPWFSYISSSTPVFNFSGKTEKGMHLYMPFSAILKRGKIIS